MKISVCIATYNGSRFIKAQLESILPQVSSSDEIIVSDDGSSDNTIEEILQLNDSRIKIINSKKYGSPSSNFENAIRNATGDIIFLSDQDDIWLSNRVEVFLNNFLDSDLVMSDCIIVNQDLIMLNESFFKQNRSKRGIVNNLHKNSYIGCCMAFRKEMLHYILPFPPKIPMHDSWIGMVGECFFRVKFISEKLLLYRRHSNNVSNSGETSKYSLGKKITFRFQLLFGLLKCYVRMKFKSFSNETLIK